jgi:ADP-ribose pyrophosphatase YjhB (NUDIX family)
MNWMQKHALVALTEHEDGQLSALKPANVESNLFSYHLNNLIHDGYVLRDGHQYKLSPLGKQLAGVINVDSGSVRLQAKIVSMIIAQNEKKEYLLFKWQRQPFYGQISFPYGKSDFNKSIWQNVQEEIDKKTSLVGIPKYMGDCYVLYRENGICISHMLVHVFKLIKFTGTAESKVRTGSTFWANPNNLAKESFAPGFFEILQSFNANSLCNLQEFIIDKK